MYPAKRILQVAGIDFYSNLSLHSLHFEFNGDADTISYSSDVENIVTMARIHHGSVIENGDTVALLFK